MSTHLNSVQALRALEDVGPLARRARLILDKARELDRPFTDREMMLKLGFSDPNTVRPRITEMLDYGYLMPAGNTTDTLTAKQVRLTRAATPAELLTAKTRHSPQPNQLSLF